MVSNIDFAVLILYLVLMLFIGFYSSKKIKNSDDYVLAGRKLGYIMTVGTLVATMIGASATMGKAGMASQKGIAMAWSGIAIAIGYLCFSLFANKLRLSGNWYIPDVLEKRYGKNIKTFSSVIITLAVIAVYGAQLIAMGIIFNLAGNPLGISYQESIIIAGIILVLYTFIGGLFAVAYTDLIQILIILPLVGIILPAVVFGDKISLSQLSASLDPIMFDFWGGLPVLFIVGIILTFAPGVIIDQTIWQRAMSSKDANVAKWSPIISAGLYVFYTFAVVLIGMAAVVLMPDLLGGNASKDAVIPKMIIDYLPNGLVGLGLTALLAVAMSTASGSLLIAGVCLTKDILPPIIKKTLTPSESLKLTRISILAVGLIGIAFALSFTGLFSIMMLAYAIFVSTLFFPIMFALFWKKATRVGAFWSILISVLVLFTLYGIGKPFGIEPIIPVLFLNLVIMVSLSLITYKPELATQPILNGNELKITEKECF